jgi:site-specific recombinase XerD
MQRGRKLPDVLTPEEQEQILREIYRPTDKELRDRLMIRLMLNTGMRSAEVLNLKIKNCDLKTGKVKVLGKGKKERVLWINGLDLNILQQHLAKQREGQEYVFVNRFGTAIQPRYLRSMVKEVAGTSGIDKDVHPHLLRHTFATDLYRKTNNLRLTQKALGHARITTTEIYTHIIDSELEEAMKGLRGS